jgi:hypothetical protein
VLAQNANVICKTTIYEEIVGYASQEYMTVLIYDGNAPLERGTVRLDFESLSGNRTRIVMHADMEMKYGLLGKLMGPLAKSQFGKAFESLLAGNARYVEQRAA